MAARKKLLVPSATSMLFTLHFLSAFLGERTSGDFTPRSLNVRKDGHDQDLDMQVDVVAPSVTTTAGSTSSLGIRFDPPLLDFQEQSVGMPKLETIHVYNPSPSQPLHLNSISGDSPVFHASFFGSKVLKAGESTTFDVIFLPRLIEKLQTTLYIQTSLGTFNYKLQGVGVANKFRLRSLLGARIPLNATYSPLISMYNPFNTSLQITEMYSSGGELHLELLTGQPQGIKSLWEIRPYETKAIGRANYFGRAATNHTSFIRIRTSHNSSPSIVLPVEVEVLEAASLFLSREILDFGILKSGESKSLPLYVLNTAAHQVHIKAITVEPENRAIEVEYTSIILKPGSKYTKIAVITFHSDRMSEPQQMSGMFSVRADGRTSYQLEVPFEVNVLHGSLSYEKSKTLFRVGQPPFHPVVHQIPLANRFRVPIVLYDVKLPSRAHEFFNVSSLSEPFVLPADSEWYYPFSVQFLPMSSDCLFNTSLRLYTNSTYFTIPLYCYDGRIKYSVEGASDEEDVLDYGVLSESDVGSKIFTVHNINPVEVQITSFTLSPGLPLTTVELLSIQPTNHSSTSPPVAPPPPKPPYFIDVGHSASFRVNVTRPTAKGAFSGEILIQTSFDKSLHIPVYYKTVMGGLKISPQFLTFEPTFPYSIAKVSVYATNLYQQPVSVTSVRREPEDARFTFEGRENDEPIRISSKETIQIGTAVFDPLHKAAVESVYLGVGGNGSWQSAYAIATSSSGDDKARVGGAKHNDPKTDLKRFSSLWKAWSSLVEEGTNVLNFSYVLTSDIGFEHKIPGSATLMWPQLLDNEKSSVVAFPITTIGSSHLQVVNVSNPSGHPVLIQPVLLQYYAKPKPMVDFLSDQLASDLDLSPIQSNSFTFMRDDAVFETDSLAEAVVQPDDHYQITVLFTPKTELEASTLLLIRNNLTVLDYVVLRGRGTQGVFSIDGIQPGSDPLTFEFTQAMMERCHAGSLFEPMKMSRVFTMYNSGSTLLTLYLVGVGAGGREEGGFSVLNYHREIIIKPNKTKSIEISFTPDFTISRITNTLQFKTSTGTELLFPLVAVLPHNLLAMCYAMQPRPEWERTIVWISVPFWICVLVTIVAVVLVQTNFGFSPMLSYHDDKSLPAVQATGGKVFDLRDVGPVAVEHSTADTSMNRKLNSKPPETLSSLSDSHSSFTLKSHPPPSKPAPHHGDSMSPHMETTGPSTKHLTRATPNTSVASTIPESKGKQQSAEDTGPSLAEKHHSDSVEQFGREMDFDTPIFEDGSHLEQSDLIESHHVLSANVSQLPQQQQMLPLQPASNQDPSSSASSSLSSFSAKATPDIQMASAIVTHSTSNTSIRIPSDAAKSSKTDEVHRKVEADSQQALPSQLPGPENTSPTTGAGASFPPPPPPSNTSNTSSSAGRKLKSSRKSGSKLQKSGQVTVADPNSCSSGNGGNGGNGGTAPGRATSAPAVVSGVSSQRLDRDSLERKESESSLKSTDSDSICSSLDKSDEKEESECAVAPPPPTTTSKEAATDNSKKATVTLSAETISKLKPHQLSLAKEPNTGQTMHISETTPPSSDGSSGNTPLEAADEGEVKRDAGNSKSKSKRKLRQQKKEEKSKRREKERVSKAAKEKSQNGAMEEPSELLDEESTTATAEESAAPSKAGSKPSTPHSPMKPLQSQKGKPQQQQQQQKSKPAVERHSRQLESTSIAKLAEVAENTGERSTPPLLQPKGVSVPSTAIKSSSRNANTSTKPQYEDIISDPFSRNPDRSTYASKKTSSKKSADKTKAEPEVGASDGAVGVIESAVENDGVESREDLKASLDGSDESLEDEGESTSPDAGDVELDSVASKLKGHNSPHDLAASLLSKIPMKRSPAPRKSNSKLAQKAMEALEYYEDDAEIAKQESLEGSEEVEKIAPQRPNTLSPIKDSQASLSTPSPPPLSGDQNKASSLSLDAEPFYPSSNFKSKKHSRSSGQKHDGRKAKDRKSSAESKDSAETKMGHNKGSSHSQRSSRAPPVVEGSNSSGSSSSLGSVDKTMIDRADFYQQHVPEKAPVPSAFSYREPQSYSKYDMLFDAQDQVGEFGRRTGRDAGGFYGHDVDDAVHDVPERAVRGYDMGAGVDPAAYLMHKSGRVAQPAQSGRRALYNQQQLQQQQQQQQKFHAMSGYPHAPPPPPPGFSLDGPPSSRMQPFEDDFKRQQFLRRRKLIQDLYRQERAALAAVYAREQARKSAEALSSLHHHPPPPPMRMGPGFHQEPPGHLPPPPPPPHHHAAMAAASPVSGGGTGGGGGGGGRSSLWDEYLDTNIPASSHLRGYEDRPAPPMTSDVDPHLSSSPYLSSGLGPPPQAPPINRGRSLSEASDIGGELLSNYHPPGLQSPTSMGPPGYQRAPGAEYSRLEQHQLRQDHEGLVARKESPLMLENQQKMRGLAWPSETEDPSTTNGGWEEKEAWMMEPPLPSSTPTSGAPTTMGGARDLGTTMGLPATGVETGLVAPAVTTNTSNTYALFENQSIWSLNNSGSETSNLLSWAMLGAAEHQQQQQQQQP